MQQCTDCVVYEIMKPFKSGKLRAASIKTQHSGSTMRCRTTTGHYEALDKKATQCKAVMPKSMGQRSPFQHEAVD